MHPIFTALQAAALLASPALAAEKAPVLPEEPGTYQLAKVECAEGSKPAPAAFPAQGAFYLNVVGGPKGLLTAYFSRWDAKEGCWSVSPGVMFESPDSENVLLHYCLPGYVYAFGQLRPLKPFQVGLHCAGLDGDHLLVDEHGYYSRAGDRPGDFRWIDFQ